MQGVTNDNLLIREVWEANIEEEMALIREIVNDFPWIAMDTEFPGVVAKPVGSFRTSAELNYQTLRCNVDMLELIQLGLTFSDSEGNLPRCNTKHYCVWQFNFKEFSLNDDVYAQDSIDLLKESGIDFNEHRQKGCCRYHFAELLFTSGVVLNEGITWVTFHSSYDFGYLLKLLTCKNMPEDQDEFFEYMGLFFPSLYDMKYVMKFCDNLHGGLNKLAETLDVERIGPKHQAGSDSLLTLATFKKLQKTYFDEAGIKKRGSLEALAGVLFGLGTDGHDFENPVQSNGGVDGGPT